jgi:hypothetical protein
MTDTLRTDMNDFLFTPIADDANGMHLTMLSALARSGVDPWLEAAGLAALSRPEATQKLVALLARIPNGPSPGDATDTLAARLVSLLHPASPARIAKRPPAATVGRSEEPSPLSFSALPKGLRVTIYSVAIAILLGLGYQSLFAAQPAESSDSGQLLSR